MPPGVSAQDKQIGSTPGTVAKTQYSALGVREAATDQFIGHQTNDEIVQLAKDAYSNAQQTPDIAVGSIDPVGASPKIHKFIPNWNQTLTELKNDKSTLLSVPLVRNVSESSPGYDIFRYLLLDVANGAVTKQEIIEFRTLKTENNTVEVAKLVRNYKDRTYAM